MALAVAVVAVAGQATTPMLQVALVVLLAEAGTLARITVVEVARAQLGVSGVVVVAMRRTITGAAQAALVETGAVMVGLVVV